MMKRAGNLTRPFVCFLSTAKCIVFQTVSTSTKATNLVRTVVLNVFYISYPFIKQDYQIYPQYTQWCSFIENAKLTYS